MLKYGSDEYVNAIEFIKSGPVTNVLLDLYLLYVRAAQEKKESDDKRTPIPYYLIDAFAQYECNKRNSNLIKRNLENSVDINILTKFYTKVTKYYVKNYNKIHNIEYNMIIKRKVDYDILEDGRDILS